MVNIFSNLTYPFRNYSTHISSSVYKRKKVLFVSSECAPYAKVGGISSVVSSLSKSLSSRHEVKVFIPYYGCIDRKKYKTNIVYSGLLIPTGDKEKYIKANILSYRPDDQLPEIIFLDSPEYFGNRSEVYGYEDDPLRWALLSKAVLEFIKRDYFRPDILHCNDWHTGLIPNYIHSDYLSLKDISTVLTIHNLKYQGVVDMNYDYGKGIDSGYSSIEGLFSKNLKFQNFMKRGIIYSDVINVVSKGYSREVLTKEFGEGLNDLLTENKGKLFGIVNGLDYSDLNPAVDSMIEENYDAERINLRQVNKIALQKEFDLEENMDIPILSFLGRLDWQKGVDLMVEVMDKVLRNYSVQFVQVGGGDLGLVGSLRDLKQRYPDKVGIHPYPNFTLPRLVFAGADMMLYPSRFEPCGITQLEAMRYGCIPIVRKVGGLADTVDPFDTKNFKGTGFVFKDFDNFSLYGEVIRALEVYKNKKLWVRLIKNAMSKDFSWTKSAAEYERLYDRALKLNKII